MSELGNHACGNGADRETGDGGSRFVTSEPVEATAARTASGTADNGDVARVVVVADRQGEVIECASGSPYWASSRPERSPRRFRSSGYRCLERSPGPAQGVSAPAGIRVAESHAVGEKRKRARIGIAGVLGGFEQSFAAAIASSA